MTCSIKAFQKLKSWLTIFFQVHQKDAARFSPFYSIIKCNISINILQKHICSSLQTRIKSSLGFWISKHNWGSYMILFKNISDLGFLGSRLIITWNKTKDTKRQRQNEGLMNVKKAAFVWGSWHCCHTSCPVWLCHADVRVAHRWVLEPPPFAAKHFKASCHWLQPALKHSTSKQQWSGVTDKQHRHPCSRDGQTAGLGNLVSWPDLLRPHPSIQPQREPPIAKWNCHLSPTGDNENELDNFNCSL